MGQDSESHSWRIALRGDLDVESAPDLQAQIDAFVAQRASLVIVDLTEVSFLDSSGLRALVHGARALQETGGRLLVEGASGAVARVLELTDLLERLTQGD